MNLCTHTVLVCLAGLFCALNAAAEGVGGGARSGGSKSDGGGRDSNYILGPYRQPEMALIQEHAKELGITSDQRKKLEYLQDKIDQSRDKVLRATQKDLFKEIIVSKKDGDEEKMRELRDKAREIVTKSGAGDELKDEYAKILSPEQIAKVKELKERGGDRKVADKPEKGDRGDREREKERDREAAEVKKPVDPNKPPSLFNEK